MKRAGNLERLRGETFDILVIGGGATGLGAALDAASRGFRTALVEAGDFASATSSRSTKLVHGGVRYLRDGDVGLVREALRERTRLLRNAPHLVREQRFLIPAYKRSAYLFYRAGLLAYDALAGRSPFSRSKGVKPATACELFPALLSDGLRGGVVYSDGVFDDSRLGIALARTAHARGAALANYVRVERFLYEGSRVAGAACVDVERNDRFDVRATATINATGIFIDELRRVNDPKARALLAFSRGSHIVVPAGTLGNPRAALLIPQTSDGRVVFAVPWHDHVIVGTTEVEIPAAETDPRPSGDEISYILETVNRFIRTPLARHNVTASFAGVRPLVDRKAAPTAKLSREHVVETSPTGLVNVTGGKWTTYRKMAEDAVDAAITAAASALEARPSQTAGLELYGADGADARERDELATTYAPLAQPLHPALPYRFADVAYGARHEMARNAEDALARRTRATFLNEAAARECADAVAELVGGIVKDLG